jgi:hypothetical protein
MDTDSTGSSHSSEESSSEVSLEYESSSFDSDSEVHPFMYEPVLASASSSTSGTEGSDSDESVSSRLLNLDW